MAAGNIGSMFQAGIDVLGSSVDEETGTVILQTGDISNEFHEADNVEIWGPVNWIARPSTPQPGKANASCQAITIRESDNDKAFAFRDLRLQKNGALQPGEFMACAGGEDGSAQGRILGKANGTVALYTSEGNASGGGSIAVQVNATDGVALSTPWGAITISPEGLKIVWGSSGIQLNNDGITLIGKGIALNGANVSLGSNAVQPIIWGPTGISGVASTSVKVAI